MRTVLRPSRRRLSGIGLSALLLAGAPVPGLAAGDQPDRAADPARLQFFERQVRPLLVENCYSCHGPTRQKGGLRLDSRAAALKGGESGAAVVPGKPEESLLVEAVNHEGLEMPPTGKLEPAKIEVLSRWVRMGAPWPSGVENRDPLAARQGSGSDPGRAASRLGEDARGFWSLQPLRSLEAAESACALVLAPSDPWFDWPRNTLDRFVLRSLLERGLTPAPEADRRTLIRRATFDMTGLPPTPAEIDAFLADSSSDAYERLVDRLLASARYGQRWGRAWLDLVRYAESDGYRQDAFRPDAWRYRDYVVYSFNADKPYDLFLTEQLAGDELRPRDLDARVATGFLRLGTYEFNQRDVRGQWTAILDDLTDVAGEVFLGLSIGCARCHDHKFDPILQEDYYRLQAFFAPLRMRDDLPLAGPAEVAEHARRQAEWERQTAELRRRIDALEEPQRRQAARDAVDKFPPEIQAILAKPSRERTALETQLADLADRQVKLEYDRVPALKGQDKARRDELRGQLARFDRIKPAPLPGVLAATDVGPVAPRTAIPGSRDARTIAPGFLTVLDAVPAAITPVSAGAPTTGRRLALARWLTRPDHPLTTRVLVNRVWQGHFGKGLVATSSDFGRLGDRPSHPELLDWLARRFVADGWRLKPLHRLILTSAAYRQAALRGESETAAARRVDPDDRLLWKQTVRRLEAEEIRDAMLAVSGELEERPGGPSAAAARPRRAIDTQLFRNSRDALLDAFDAPDGYASTGRRNTTTTPTQALLLINGGWTLDRARAFARRLERLAGNNKSGAALDEARIVLAYRLAFGREPEPEELSDAAAYLAGQDRRGASPGGRAAHAALVDFCHALLNSNEFLYVD